MTKTISKGKENAGVRVLMYIKGGTLKEGLEI